MFPLYSAGMSSEWIYDDDDDGLSSLTTLLPEEYREITVTSNLTHHYVYSAVETVLVTIVAPVIFTVGILGNAAVILVFCRVPEIRTTTNYFLISLALADIVFLLSAVPAYWAQYLTSTIPRDFSHLGIVYCKTHTYFADVGILVSCLTIGLVTVERYLAICRPFLYRSFGEMKRIVFSCCLVWIVSFLYKIPDLHFTNVSLSPTVIVWPNETRYRDYPTRYSTCDYCQPRNHVPCLRFRYSLALDQILFLVEIPLISILYTCVVFKLRRLMSSSSSSSSNNNNNDNNTTATRLVPKRNIQESLMVIRMLIITIVVFVLCISPFRVVNLLDIFGQPLPIDSIILVHLGRMMMYTNSAINPVLYNLMSKNFRKGFLEIFCCRRRTRFTNTRAVFQRVLFTDVELNHSLQNNICSGLNYHMVVRHNGTPQMDVDGSLLQTAL